MKKTLAILLTVAMAFSLFAGCAQTNSDSGDKQGDTQTIVAPDGTEVEVPVADDANKITDLVTSGTVGREISTLCIFNTSSPGTFKTTVNFYDPLVTVNSAGEFVPCLAESWETSEDGLTWTFHIREGATWVDYQGNVKADVKAEDWLWGMEWVLNFHKNDSYNTTSPISVLEGAQEYYDYTSNLSEEEAMKLDLTKFSEMVGVEAVDDNTLVYHLKARCPYFISLTTSLGFYSVSGDFLKEIGNENFVSCTYDKMWYSGPYMMVEWVENNMRRMVPNPEYWDETVERFNSWTCYMVESTDVAYQMYCNGEIDEVQLNASYAHLINSNPDDPNYGKIVKMVPGSVSFFIWFNYAKNTEAGVPDDNWNKAVANEAFRQSIYYGADLTNYFAYTNPYEPLSLSINTITAYNMTKLSDGTDYTDLVLEEIGVPRVNETYPHMDADKTAALKAQAIKELTAQGVTFPIQMDVYCSSAQTSIDETTMFKECIEDCLGSDYIQVNIKTYVSSFRQEVVNPSLSSVILDGTGASYMDPTTYLFTLCSGEQFTDSTSDLYCNVNTCEYSAVTDLFKEFSDMVVEADQIVDTDKRLEALAKAEAFAIEHALIIPTRTNRFLFLENINLYTKPAQTNDYQGGRMVNIETNSEGYTNEDFEAFYNAYISR